MCTGYSSLAGNLIKFNQFGQLPFHLERLDEGNGIEMTMINTMLDTINMQAQIQQYKITKSRKKNTSKRQ